MRMPAAVLVFLLLGSVLTRAAGLPAGVAPLPPEIAGHWQTLEKETAKYRGLPFLRQVPAGTIDETGLRAKLAAEFRQQLPPEKIQPAEAALKAFGLIPEDLDLAHDYLQLLAGQVAGFYDPREDYLAIVSDQIAALSKASGSEQRASEAILAHELVHGLQDQHFDLERFLEADPLSDSGAAKAALVEGDATMVMLEYLLQKDFGELEGAAETFHQLGTAAVAAMGQDDAMARAPAWLRETLLFSYLQGLAFCADVERKGGPALLETAFRKDPPRSTEQVLHPEKWHTRRDDPLEVSLPDLTAVLPGTKKMAEGTLGELSVRILFSSPKVAAGWGGDRFALYRRATGQVLVWATEWDTEADRAEMTAAVAETLGPGWTVLSQGERRAVLLRGKLGEGEMGKLKKTLTPSLP